MNLQIPSVLYSLNHPLKSVWYIISETTVDMSFIRIRKSLRLIWRLSIMYPKTKLQPWNLTNWKRNEEESILILYPYYLGGTTEMIWLFSSNSRRKSEEIIYTINLIKNLNGKISKYTKSKLSFLADDTIKKTIYLYLYLSHAHKNDINQNSIKKQK